VSTEYYQVENGNEYRLGDTEEYYYRQEHDTVLAENVDRDNTLEWQKLYGDDIELYRDRDSDIPGSAILSQGC
jgi:hypothetical protein